MAIGGKDTPQVIAPPPLIVLAFVVVGFLLYWLRPLPFAIGIGYDIFGVILIIVPIAIAIWARNFSSAPARMWSLTSRRRRSSTRARSATPAIRSISACSCFISASPC